MGRVECEVSTPHAWSNQWDIGVYERYARLTPVKITFVAAAPLIVGGTDIFSGAACIHSIQRSTGGEIVSDTQTCFDGSFDRQRGAPNMDISVLLDNNGSTCALRIQGGWPDGLAIAHFVLTCLGFFTTYIILGLSTVSAMLAWAVFAVAFAVLTVADGFTLHAWSRTYCRNTSLPAIVDQLAVTTPAQADLVQKIQILAANTTSVNVVCQSATSTFLVALLAVCALSASVAVYSTHADRSMYIAELSEDTYIECQ